MHQFVSLVAVVSRVIASGVRRLSLCHDFFKPYNRYVNSVALSVRHMFILSLNEVSSYIAFWARVITDSRIHA